MRVKLTHILPVVALLSVGGVCGCASGGRSIAVSNSGDSAISDVFVEFGGAARYHVSHVAPHTAAGDKSLRDIVPVASTVRWKTTDGKALSKEVTMSKPLPETFRGRLLYQVDRNFNVQVFVMPSEYHGSLIPWGSSGDFNSAPLIPGLSE